MGLWQIVSAASANWPRIQETIELSRPLARDYMAAADRLNENVKFLIHAFGLDSPAKMLALRNPAEYSVEWVQKSLNRANCPVNVTGNYDMATKVAVEQFQHLNGLDVDGWVGPETASRLEEVP